MMRNHLPPTVPGSDIERINAFAGIVASAIKELMRQGYSIISFSADILSPGMPVIMVAPDRATHAAIASERAAHFKRDTLDGYPKRWYKLLNPPSGVNVIWIEREHA